ncbi:hypothetical protein [Kushneria indalinina]|uniref:hypothetical protein n=1 Tax=Kushneria indalinina TaxID=184067 RepID=UPI000E240F44|nr:hypothetical protein [Kushneria indalinina]
MNTWIPSPWARRLKVTSNWRLRLDNDRPTVTGLSAKDIICDWQVQKVRTTQGSAWASCHVEIANAVSTKTTSVVLKGLARDSAEKLADALRFNLNRYLLRMLASRAAMIARWRHDAFGQLYRDRWNRRSLLDQLYGERDNLFLQVRFPMLI